MRSLNKKVRYLNLSSIKSFKKVDLSRIVSVNKIQLALFFASLGFLLAFYTSLRVWFLWPFENIYSVISSLFLFLSYLLSNSCKERVFTRTDFLVPTIACAIVLIYNLLVNESVPLSYVVFVFQLFIFFMLFRLDKKYHVWLGTILCKSMAVILLLSLPMFLLYLMGFPLPSRNAEWHNLYYFSNYYFFLISDANLLDLIPRFHSIFLEPGHMGTAIVLLLSTQIGRWNRWYHIIMLIALFMSFSLAAYVLLLIVVFLHLWIQRKKIFAKALGIVALVGAIVGGSFIYNEGNNMLNQLIVMRLEINRTGDGIEGDNRVSQNFKSEFDSFMQSSDIFFGREMDNTTFGNAGYRVYLYENGIIGFILVYLFYIVSMNKGIDRRTFYAMLFLSLVNFWIRAYPLWFGFYIPYYILAYIDKDNFNLKSLENS